MQRILIIEDDQHIIMMIKRMLERLGYEIFLASNGSDGLRLFKEISVDLVITDIIMPEKEGLETIREMKRLRSGLKIIAMSGGGKLPANNYLETAKIFGAAEVLQKPFTQKQLVSAVESVLGEASDDNAQVGKDSTGSDLEQKQGR